jgi:catechol 2,3-dioxygenase-like lactoylglutathione lyase family enzyme
MTETAVKEQITHRWYARPVLFVADVNRALRFYIDILGFEKQWHEGDGAGGVCQVNRNARSSFANMPREETKRACSWN